MTTPTNTCKWCTKLLEGSWEEGAILRDRERRIFSDPSKNPPD
ncbi:Uncharacterised protein [Ewingella americana]|uniref:Uncharacterized protein n=1 Tax=Ewingella americana TaxID=41202 RepID=A0A377NFR8_9GAMM|nr:Uncharacterised protein [Ewingella americana]